MSKNYKLIVHVPLTHADKVREAIGNAGGGAIGNYTHCSFSVIGIGRFRPSKEAAPHIGENEVFEIVQEESIEVSPIPENIIKSVIAAMKAAHPYEETGFEVYEMVDVENLI